MVKDNKLVAQLDVSPNSEAMAALHLVDGHTDDEASDEEDERTQHVADKESSDPTRGNEPISSVRQATR